jgi:MoaA/NifB/PqqE/SkfB family radical SAM enzyme
MESRAIIKNNKNRNQIRRSIRLKPVLPYVEMHVVDHCNLNCKGCSHFSPIADELFTDIGEFTRDLQQLRRLVSNIEVIRLMGGEPLLHPNITDFIRSTKFFFLILMYILLAMAFFCQLCLMNFGVHVGKTQFVLI